MTGVIIAGGLGTRLRSVVADMPKCLARINGQPFLFRLLQQQARAGVSRIVLCTGYGAAQVQAAVGAEFQGVPVVYSQEDHPLGTGGALRLAWERYSGPGKWLVMNGDSYLDLDVREFCEVFAVCQCDAAIAAAHVLDGSRFGALTWAAGSCVASFEEKSGKPESKWINAGVYLMTPRFLDNLSGSAPLSLEREVFPAWIEKGIWVHTSTGKFIDIGTPESYTEAQQFFPELAA